MVAVGQLGDQTVAVTGGNDGTVALWRVGEDGLTPTGDPQPGRSPGRENEPLTCGFFHCRAGSGYAWRGPELSGWYW